ncbi:uncharacterized protein LOC116427689 [Nomia melanderi]|uniref:uncharacterized protein LOC116427689 n=1 Tax=Nomia melanderi TaxID=2448451 RepID=UPI003FCEB3EE
MVNNKDVDDATSSEDEVLKNVLKEATDHEFLKDTYFSNTENNHSTISQETSTYHNSTCSEDLTKSKSQRPYFVQNDKFENFGVTPSFQKYVAGKLDEIIEKSIKIKNKKKGNCLVTEQQDTDSKSGIKLLNSSVEFLIAEDEPEILPKRRKIKTTIDEKAILLKCKEVAVDPERILSKTDTKAWTSKRKEPEFKYKRLKNGTLVEQI